MSVVRGYIRVSTDDQADGGLGLEAYREMVFRAFDRDYRPKGFTLGGVYEDPAVSSGVPLRSRKGGGRLVLDSDSGDVIVFPKLDRGFRDTEETLREVRVLRERGVGCVFLDLPSLDLASPEGELFMTQLAGFARFEKRKIGERTKAALAVRKRQAAEKGHLNPLGNAWFGLRRVKGSKGKLVIHVPEYIDGLKILEWHAKGYTDHDIAVHMNAGSEQTACRYWWYKRKVWGARRAMIRIKLWLEEVDKEGKPKLTLPKGTPT